MQTIIMLVTSETFWVALFGVLYLLTHIAAWTPTQTDDLVVARIRRVLDLIAGNYGAARNAAERVAAAERAIRGG